MPSCELHSANRFALAAKLVLSLLPPLFAVLQTEAALIASDLRYGFITALYIRPKKNEGLRHRSFSRVSIHELSGSIGFGNPCRTDLLCHILDQQKQPAFSGPND